MKLWKTLNLPLWWDGARWMDGICLSYSSPRSTPLPLVEASSFGLYFQPSMAFGFRFWWFYLCQNDNQVRSSSLNGLWIGLGLNTSTAESRKWRNSSSHLLRRERCLLPKKSLADRTQASEQDFRPDRQPQQVPSGWFLLEPNSPLATSPSLPIEWMKLGDLNTNWKLWHHLWLPQRLLWRHPQCGWSRAPAFHDPKHQRGLPSLCLAW